MTSPKVQRIGPRKRTMAETERDIIAYVGGFYEAELRIAGRVFRRWGFVNSLVTQIRMVQIDEQIDGTWHNGIAIEPTAASALAYIKKLVTEGKP